MFSFSSTGFVPTVVPMATTRLTPPTLPSLATATTTTNNNIPVDFALLQRCERTHGWTRSYANRVWKAYMQFLELKAVHEDWGDHDDNNAPPPPQQQQPQQVIVPSIVIEKMWRQHILHVVQYVNTCMVHFGNVIAYNPDWEQLVVDMESRHKQVENTLLSLVARYARGGFDQEIWDFGFEMSNGLHQEQAQQQRPPPRNPDGHRPPPTGIPIRFSSTSHNLGGPGQQQNPGGGGTSSADADDDEITIALCCECGALTYFEIHPLLPLHHVFEMYASTGGCARGEVCRHGRNIPLNNMLFVYKGRLVHHQENAFTLGMMDQDKMFVLTVA